MLRNFTQFDAWKKSMTFARLIHELTRNFPREEIYGITSQMRRASLSVAANIAEGFGRYTMPDKKHKYVQARGELIEVMTFLYHAENVKYMDSSTKDSLLKLATEIHKILNALITKMNTSNS